MDNYFYNRGIITWMIQLPVRLWLIIFNYNPLLRRRVYIKLSYDVCCIQYAAYPNGSEACPANELEEVLSSYWPSARWIILYEWYKVNHWIDQPDVSCRCDEPIKPLIAISVYFVGSRLSQLLISSQEPLTLSNQNFDSKIFKNYLPKNIRSSIFWNANRQNHRHTFFADMMSI